MKHISVPIANTMEPISATEISPLISKCVVKVCYVGQEANRNGSVITKEVATEMGRKILGSPVVGFYDKESKDFEEHNRELAIDEENETFELIDVTRPYGFVPTDAKVWFQKFTDDGVEHEYLVTECYLWTDTYPECKRVVEQGNNQSMELHKEKTKGSWTIDSNSHDRIFIINDGLIEKLCILGEDFEPCFEGAQIQQNFSLEDFKTTLFSMMEELKEALNKGGSDIKMDKENMQETEFEKKEDKEEEKKNPSTESEKENISTEDKEEKKDDKKKKYNLEEISEYVELKSQYDELQSKFNALIKDKETLEAENTSLKEYKAAAERKEKQAMIDSFYMLSDEDKKEVIDNIDTYSLNDIEGKLSIICVRSKLNLSDNGNQQENNGFTFNLSGIEDNDSGIPDWIKAVEQNQNQKEDI